MSAKTLEEEVSLACECYYREKRYITAFEIQCFKHGYLAAATAREKEIEELRRQFKEAIGDAAILAHAYSTDNRPPTNVVVRSIDRGKKALGK